eukprot:6083141-Amphidinium_carterae.1
MLSRLLRVICVRAISIDHMGVRLGGHSVLGQGCARCGIPAGDIRRASMPNLAALFLLLMHAQHSN